MKTTVFAFALGFVSIMNPLLSQEPVSETPCSVSCNVPGLPPSVCGEDIHRWHDSLNLCTNYGYVEIPEVGYGMVVGAGPCNIRWGDGTRFALNCAYGNCEGSGQMYCGGALHDVNLSCSGGPRGDQSDVARATIDHDLMRCSGFGNGMEARCVNGSFMFNLWE